MPRAPAKPVRRRLDPELRKTRLLRVAAEIVVRDGLTSISMQRVAERAGVSKGLVYNYFPSCQALLYELLRRESATIYEKQVAAARDIEDFVELLRVVTRVYLRHVAEHGHLLRPLLAEPALAAELEREHRTVRPRAVRRFSRLMHEQYGIPLPDAVAAADLLMDLSGAAARRMQETGESPEYLEDLCVQLVLRGVDGLANGLDRQASVPMATTRARAPAKRVRPARVPARASRAARGSPSAARRSAGSARAPRSPR
jgi:AcrR family transcriptional regulator